MAYLFVQYPKCGTCRKARAWLDENGVTYEARHIVEENPTKEELAAWIAASSLAPRRFFNTSGILYREMQLKDKLPSMSEAEQIALLATQGMLVKRPLLIGDGTVLVGFNAEQWRAALGEKA